MIRKILAEEIDDIFVSGYTEHTETYYKFSPLFWWVYIKYNEKYLVLSSNDGTISYEYCKAIECRFDIENQDLFTITSISKNKFGKVSLLDLIYDEFENLVSIGIFIFENQQYLFFDSINVNGFIIKESQKREIFLYKLSNEKFRLITYQI